MATLIQNGIDFTINSELVGNLGSGKYSHASNLDGANNINADKIAKKGLSFPSINCIDIDWNGAKLDNVELSELDNGNTINTTGQLLALINDLQEQINAIVYIMNGGNQGGGSTGGTTGGDSVTPTPTPPPSSTTTTVSPTGTQTRTPL